MSSDEEYIKPSEIARRLKVTRGAVYKWIREGKLEGVRFGENAVRVPLSSFNAFVERAKAEGGTQKNGAPGGLALLGV